MKTARNLVALLVLVAVVGCANMRLNYMVTEKSYKNAVAFAADEGEAGRMSLETAEKLDPFITGGNTALIFWHDLLVNTPEGEVPDIPAWIFRNITEAIDVLEAYMLKKGGSQ